MPAPRQHLQRTAPLKRTPFRTKAPELKMIAGMPWPDGHVKESEFQSDVERRAGQLGWMSAHSHLPFFDSPGWPDLALLHPVKKRFMVRELKVTTKTGRIPKPSPHQQDWLNGLIACGIDAGVWTYPHDNDRINAELMA